MVQQTQWTAGAIENLALNPSDPNTPQVVKKIDQTLLDVSGWVTENSTSPLYIGTQTLSEDFAQVEASWVVYKKNMSLHDNALNTANSLKCWDVTNNIALIIEKMVYLKQNKLINMFYLSLAVAMILLLLIIYLTRVYIHSQMKKHAIHDYETKLFNQKYFLSQLKTSCARAVRYKHPLSMLSISINDFEEGSDTYDIKTKEQILKMLGGLIISLTRTSDITCRYDEDHFFILLADTEEKNASILEGRVRETLEKHDFMANPELKFKFSTIHFNTEETAEAFVARAQSLLH